MHKPAFCLMLVLFSCCRLSLAQSGNAGFVNITQLNGLPSNETYCVYKDSRQYIWIATDQGVVRHKGMSMQTINQLPDNVIFKIREDSKGRVWFFSHSGRTAYFYKEKLYPYRFNDSITKYIDKILINDAYANDADEIVLNSETVGHNFKITKLGKVVKDYDNYDLKDIDSSMIIITKNNKDGLITHFLNPYLVSVYHFLKIIRTDLDTPITYSIPSNFPSAKQCGALNLKDRALLFWGGRQLLKLQSDGTYQVKEFSTRILSANFDPVNQSIIVGLFDGGIAYLNEHLDILSVNVLDHHSVTSIEVDNEGELWLSTLENGVYYSKNKNSYKQFFNLYSPQIAERIVNVADSFILFANSNGIFQLKDTATQTILEEKNSFVGDLILSSQQDILFARANDFNVNCLLRKSPFNFIRNIISIPSSFEIVELSANNYIANYYNALTRIMPLPETDRTGKSFRQTFLPLNNIKIKALMPKDSNQIYYGAGNSIGLFDVRNNSFQNFNISSQIFANGVSCMRKIDDHMYAVGLNFGGILLMKDTVVIGKIMDSSGLLDNSIKYLMVDGNRLIAATPKGISVISFSSFTPLHYTVKNLGENAGLNNLIIYQMVKFKNDVLIATSKGIYNLSNLEELLHQKPIPIPLYFTTINYFKGDTSGIENISLPFQYNRLVVNFDAICYNTPGQLKYYYRLINDTDSDWQNIESTQIILENLPPGKYELQVKAELPSQQRFPRYKHYQSQF